MTRFASVCFSLLFALLLPVAELAAQFETSKIQIESADQLPRHTYPVPESARALVEDDAQFAALAAKLETDLKADLATAQNSRSNDKGSNGHGIAWTLRPAGRPMSSSCWPSLRTQ